ncbi:MAG TPA: hypothetical protein PKK59_07540 [Anaerolineaceae bacterium]|nr:hypothetical protein [Anaerolineaceae bacterium]
MFIAFIMAYFAALSSRFYTSNLPARRARAYNEDQLPVGQRARLLLL